MERKEKRGVKWDGENWWYKVEYQGAVNSRLRRRLWSKILRGEEMGGIN